MLDGERVQEIGKEGTVRPAMQKRCAKGQHPFECIEPVNEHG